MLMEKLHYYFVLHLVCAILFLKFKIFYVDMAGFLQHKIIMRNGSHSLTERMTGHRTRELYGRKRFHFKLELRKNKEKEKLHSP